MTLLFVKTRTITLLLWECWSQGFPSLLLLVVEGKPYIIVQGLNNICLAKLVTLVFSALLMSFWHFLGLFGLSSIYSNFIGRWYFWSLVNWWQRSAFSKSLLDLLHFGWTISLLDESRAALKKIKLNLQVKFKGHSNIPTKRMMTHQGHQAHFCNAFVIILCRWSIYICDTYEVKIITFAEDCKS